MQRLKDYCGIFAWQAGLGYLLLWAVTYWTLADGAAVFGRSGACHADSAQVLFYWACDPESPLSILASVVNFALTATVWAPVFVAAATVDPGAATIAVPIVAVHVFGLPFGILVLIRLLARAFDAMRALRRRIHRGCLGHHGGGERRPPSRGKRAAMPGAGSAGIDLSAVRSRRGTRSHKGSQAQTPDQSSGAERSCFSARPI